MRRPGRTFCGIAWARQSFARCHHRYRALEPPGTPFCGDICRSDTRSGSRLASLGGRAPVLSLIQIPTGLRSHINVRQIGTRLGGWLRRHERSTRTRDAECEGDVVKREQLHLWIRQEEHLALKLCSEADDVPVTRIVRRLIRDYLHSRSMRGARKPGRDIWPLRPRDTVGP